MKIIKYPDGQVNVQVDIHDDSPSIIRMRINSYEDLFVLKSLVDVYNYNNLELKELVIPCLFGQRSDRKFQHNESFGLKHISDFINSFNFKKVTIFDPHSDVSLALINNSIKESSFEYIKKVIEDLDGPGLSKSIKDTLVLVSPDAGAYKKVFKYAEDLNLPCVAANKFRDLNGDITLNILGDVKDKNCLIVDDLLDGGYTFILLARKLREQGANKVFLYISHAYFNKGTDELLDVINHIYCTNSVKDLDYSEVTQFKII